MKFFFTGIFIQIIIFPIYLGAMGTAEVMLMYAGLYNPDTEDNAIKQTRKSNLSQRGSNLYNRLQVENEEAEKSFVKQPRKSKLSERGVSLYKRLQVASKEPEKVSQLNFEARSSNSKEPIDVTSTVFTVLINEKAYRDDLGSTINYGSSLQAELEQENNRLKVEEILKEYEIVEKPAIFETSKQSLLGSALQSAQKFSGG